MMGKQIKDFEVYLVHVDKEKCYGCGECAAICKTDAIILTEI
jgi:ferredoxin